jgi:Phage tail lysozyme
MRKYLLIAVALVALSGLVTVIVDYATVDESGYGAVMRFFGYGVPGEREIPESLEERGLHLMDRLINVHGWTPEAAAIATGQAQVESNLTTGGPPGDNGRSHELFMWKDDRFEKLKAFAKERDHDYRDVDVQIDFFADEVTHRSEPELEWKNVTDLDQAARLGHLFEVYSSNTTGARVEDAKMWLRIYREKHDSKQGEARLEAR